METTMTKTAVNPDNSYKDSFHLFSTDEAEYIEALRGLGANRQTETVKVKSIVFKPMPTMAEIQGCYAEDEALLSAALDSIESGVRIYVELNDIPFVLRDSALSSIYERLRISGDVLGDLPAELLASHLNDYASYACNDEVCCKRVITIITLNQWQPAHS